MLSVFCQIQSQIHRKTRSSASSGADLHQFLLPYILAKRGSLSTPNQTYTCSTWILLSSLLSSLFSNGGTNNSRMVRVLRRYQSDGHNQILHEEPDRVPEGQEVEAT